MAEELDLKQLAQRRVMEGQAHLTILGGTVAAGRLAEWLAGWPLDEMPWRLWECVSDLRLERATPLPSVKQLERGRLFGPGGDLTLRRDSEVCFRWHFVGPSGRCAPAGAECMRDFWEGRSGMTLTRVDRQAILWGAWNQKLGRWYDNRVGFARLNYPVSAGQRHVYLHYREYLEAGRVAFVWLLGLGERRYDPFLDEEEYNGRAG